MTKITFTLLVLLGSTSVWAVDRIDHPSGLLRSFKQNAPTELQNRPDAIGRFLQEQFAEAGEHFEWVAKRKIVDNTHDHNFFELRFRGRKVVDHYLKVHYNHDGWVQYATSGWQVPFELAPLPTNTPERIQAVKNAWRDHLTKKYGHFDGILAVEPIVWVDQKNKRAYYALEVIVASQRPWYRYHIFVEQQTGAVLARKPIARFVGNDVYQIHPDRSAPAAVDLSNLVSGIISDDNFHLYRHQGSAAVVAKEINPDHDFTGEDPNWSAHAPYPVSYDYECESGVDGGCPNQEFNAVNVYYHLREYRETLSGYFTTLGVSPTFALDPMTVVVNTLSIDLDGDGDGDDEANNAFYTPTLELSDGSSVDGGVFFLRPAFGISSSCGDDPVQFFDLAREAIVIVHEYQHYITDTITGMVSASDGFNIGDALHEGYSDYFGASQVTGLAGEDVTVIGEYAFKNCAGLRRDISTLRVLTGQETSRYQVGLTFASGLWQIREEQGREVADQMALKSLFFLSTTPNFFDAVEAIAAADQALSGGENTANIRDIYYTQLGFAGGATNMFRDPQHYVIEMGFRSCSAAKRSHSSAGVSVLVFLVWLGMTLWVGRRRAYHR